MSRIGLTLWMGVTLEFPPTKPPPKRAKQRKCDRFMHDVAIRLKRRAVNVSVYNSNVYFHQIEQVRQSIHIASSAGREADEIRAALSRGCNAGESVYRTVLADSNAIDVCGPVPVFKVDGSVVPISRTREVVGNQM